MRTGGSRVRSGAFGPFPCVLGVVGFVRVLSVDSRAPWVLSGFVRVRSFHSRAPGVRSGSPGVHSGTFGPSSVSFGYVRSIPSLPECGPVPSGALSPFLCAHRVVVLVGAGSVHSRAPWGSYGCVRSIPARHGGRRFRSGPFPRALFVVVFLWVLLVHSRAPLGW